MFCYIYKFSLRHPVWVEEINIKAYKSILYCWLIWCRYPSSPARDTEAVSGYGCDAVVFLVFNEYAKDCKTPVYGHKYGGASQVTGNTVYCKERI